MSRPEHPQSPPTITGAHRAVPRVGRRVPSPAPSPYEPYLDGLFTYCLSVLCERDTAVAALGDTLAVAERYRGRLRDPELRRPWLYAIARWACLRRLAEGRPAVGSPETSQQAAQERRRELAALAWPEAAGTSPEQREAIELAVRHQLSEREIAMVTGMDREIARALLSRAACEIERTRTALAVVELGSCPAVARLAGDTQVLLGTALRRELVRHVDECPACRLTAEQAVAAGPWPGTATPSVLSVLEAPRQAAHSAMQHSLRAMRAGGHRPVPHFDRRGFPVDSKDRAARRALIRHRAVTTTVVAAVVAAPALALWAAYRSAPHTGESQDATTVSATEADGGDGYSYQKAGSSGRLAEERGRKDGSGGPSALPGSPGASPSGTGSVSSAPGAPGSPSPSGSGGSGAPSPGRLTVSAQPAGTDTLITLTNEGGSPIHWAASTGASWLQLSLAAGQLSPGESVTVTVTVNRQAEPAGPWRGRIVFTPSGAMVTIEGQGQPSPTPSATTTPTPRASAS
ncbi:BACON domain-containing protein [Streptomyces sp. RPT161]|uniref:BACON domain-containing protein n=1 Tax=Streptomyces sp. RPT161 TaxID=3015993 RepID=UPI0022B8C5CC|nr:sigma-70 family RNA polymerase sigma factor [Streptomyces sp. RPT161]